MRQRLVRGYATAPLALVVAAALASCSAGTEAGTLDPQHLSGAKADAGLVKIRGAVVIAADNPGDPSTLSMTIINDGTTDDALTGVQLTGPDGDIDVTLKPASVDLPSETATVIPTDSRPAISVDGTNFEVGSYVTATFDFENAGSTTMQILALSEAGVYGGN